MQKYYLFSLHNVYRAAYHAEKFRGKWRVLVERIERQDDNDWREDRMPASVVASIEKTLEADYARQWNVA